MDNLTGAGSILPLIVERRVLVHDPFVVVDVGCSGGISPAWRLLEPDLIALGVDSNLAECVRLQRAEQNPRVKYVPAFVGLPDTHPLVQQEPDLWGNNPWSRLSAAEALENRRERPQASPPVVEPTASFEDGQGSAEPSERLLLTDLLQAQDVHWADVIKIDVDGEDFRIIASLEGHFDRLRVLGLGVEVNFFGSARGTDNTFHNVDRFLKSQGFELMDLTLRRYSTRHLPARFVMGIGPTEFGRIIQGDAFWARDIANPLRRSEFNPSPVEVMKLCCLYDLVGLPDCAAELLVTFRVELEDMIDVDLLLDVLIRDVTRRRVPYTDYLEMFNRDPTRFCHRSLLSRIRSRLSRLVPLVLR